MKVTLKTWDKDRAGSVILFVLLTLMFGFITLAVFFGDEWPPIWMYVFCPAITAVFAWALYVTVSSKHQWCMDAVKGEMSFKELKQSVEVEEYEEPIVFFFDPSYDEDEDGHFETKYRMLISKSWVLLGQDMGKPLCIPKAKVVKVSGEHDVHEALGPGHPAWDGYFLRLELENGKQYVTGLFAADMQDPAKKMVHEHFPQLEFERFPSPSPFSEEN